MEFLLKASAIFIIFYSFYALWLQKETFFNANRWFLLSGILLACCLPFVIIPVYVNATPNTLNLDAFAAVPSKHNTNGIHIEDVLLTIYYIGIVFCLGRFLIELKSLQSFFSKHKVTKRDRYRFIETKDEIAPFSFFNAIVYNPNQFSSSELEHVLNHEKIHVNQWHSLDILFVKIATIFFWFNPVIWLYKKALIQNLEFIADHNALQQSNSSKGYQNLLLKTSLPSHHMALTNNFYNSLIKKRIIMLHKSNSKTINFLKYACVIPLLLVFLMSFNTKTINKTGPTESNLRTQHLKDGELVSIITKDDTDDQLEAVKNAFESQNVTLKFKNVKRNSANEIIAISIDAKSKVNKLKYDLDSETPITPIKITFNNSTDKLEIGSSKSNSNIVFASGKQAHVVNTDSNNAFVIQTSDGASSFVVKKIEDDDQDHNIMFISEDGKTTHVSSKNEEIEWVNENGETVEIEKTKELTDHKVKFRSQDENADPLIILEGKKISKTEMEALNPDRIDSVNVLRGKKSIEEYGDEGKDGVILITLKK